MDSQKETPDKENARMSWKDLEQSDSELAAFGLERFQGRVAYLATTRQDGSPRLHPVTPIIGQGRLFVFMPPTSPKVRDLQRDSRYMMHSRVDDTDGSNGEFFLSGRARLVEDKERQTITTHLVKPTHHDRSLLFEFSVERASSIVYENGVPIRHTWREQNESSMEQAAATSSAPR